MQVKLGQDKFLWMHHGEMNQMTPHERTKARKHLCIWYQNARAGVKWMGFEATFVHI